MQDEYRSARRGEYNAETTYTFTFYTFYPLSTRKVSFRSYTVDLLYTNVLHISESKTSHESSVYYKMKLLDEGQLHSKVQCNLDCIKGFSRIHFFDIDR